jgi:hypothetical protein
MNQEICDTKLPFKEPQMLTGGVRSFNSILPGTTAEQPATLAVGGRAFRTFTGNETKMEGGVNHLKKAKKWLGYAGDVAKEGFNIFDQVKSRGAGKKPTKKQMLEMEGAGFWEDFGRGFKQGFSGGADIATGVMTADPQKMKEGMQQITAGNLRKKRRTKKQMMEEMAGGVNHLKKAKKWLGFAGDVAKEGFNIFDQVKSRGAGMVYSQSLKDAIGGSCGSCEGGAKSGKMAKGSQEMKDHMARIRAMRKK